MARTTGDSYGTPLGARWLNQIAREVVEELSELVDEAVDAMLVDGYPGGTQPVTVKDLKAMRPLEAIAELEGMMADPTTAAEGARLTSQYMAWLAQQLQDAQEVA